MSFFKEGWQELRKHATPMNFAVAVVAVLILLGVSVLLLGVAGQPSTDQNSLKVDSYLNKGGSAYVLFSGPTLPTAARERAECRRLKLVFSGRVVRQANATTYKTFVFCAEATAGLKVVQEQRQGDTLAQEISSAAALTGEQARQLCLKRGLRLDSMKLVSVARKQYLTQINCRGEIAPPGD